MGLPNADVYGIMRKSLVGLALEQLLKNKKIGKFGNLYQFGKLGDMGKLGSITPSCFLIVYDSQ